MANQINVIKPYKWNGTWVFDDEQVGLLKEPFVSGMPEIINEVTKDIPNAHDGFIAVFSGNAFPGFNVELKFVRGEYGGNWYQWTKTRQEGWLCPALFKYFEAAPEALYIKVEPLAQ